MRRLFDEIIYLVNELVLMRILKEVQITNEFGYKNLCEDLDYLEDQLDTLLNQKLQMEDRIIKNGVKEIEKQKYSSFMNN